MCVCIAQGGYRKVLSLTARSKDGKLVQTTSPLNWYKRQSHISGLQRRKTQYRRIAYLYNVTVIRCVYEIVAGGIRDEGVCFTLWDAAQGMCVGSLDVYHIPHNTPVVF